MTNRHKEKFVGLHSHSVFSVFDAIGYPNEHIDFAVSNGAEALALTDHGNMDGLSYQVLHSKKINANGTKFKPIFGVEAYFIPSIAEWATVRESLKTDKKGKEEDESKTVVENEEETKSDSKSMLNKRHHLVLLAQNNIGLKNIYKMISDSYQPENFYRYPRIDLEMLKQHNEGVIVLQACLGGYLAKAMWEMKDKPRDDIKTEMKKRAQQFVDIFGDRYYLEMQWNAIPEQHFLNKLFLEISKEMNIKIVSTADAHYPNPDAWKTREIYKRLGWLNNKPDYGVDSLPKTREELKYEIYPKNYNQMFESYKKYSELCGEAYDDQDVISSLEETSRIAFDRIEDFYPDTKVKLPTFALDKTKTPIKQLTEICIESMKQKALDKDSKYVERLFKELKVIDTRDFASYFLTMKLISDEARTFQLCSPGRGSAAGSLISFLCGITTLDPVKHNLQFERFLLADGTDYPDIDFDCSNPMALKDYFIDKWGKFSVVPITNYNTLKFRSLIKDVSKLFGIDYAEVNSVTSTMLAEATPEAKKKNGIRAGMYEPTYEELLEFSPSLNKFFLKHPQIKESIEGLSGMVKSASRHAGGIILGDNLSTEMPLKVSGGVVQTPWSEGQNVRHLEPFGFIKYDILGIETLNVMEQCIRKILMKKNNTKDVSFQEIKEWYNSHLDPSTNNLDDQEVFQNVFIDGKFPGIFQFTDSKAQEFCKKVEPKSIYDISVITSIYRPGPLSANVHHDFLKAKKGEFKIKFNHPLIKESLKESSGFIIYQEQISHIANQLGKDIDLNEANLLRKLLTKKGTGKGLDKIEEIKVKFVAGCQEKGMTRREIDEIWDTMENFATYGFNKCLDADHTFVRIKSGAVKKIKHVIVGDFVQSKNGFVEVKDVIYQGVKSCLNVKTSLGKTLCATKDHKVETELGMVTLENAINLKLKLLNESGIYEEIVSAEQKPYETDTYDLEVDHPDHTFFANDISVSNSHAISYSIISYQCAYLFTKHPYEWLSSFLDKETDDKKEAAISLVKSLGYSIEPVSIQNSDEFWTYDEGKFIQPFTSIKGLGEKAIEQIYLARPFSSIEDLLFNEKMTYSKFNKRALDVLIRSDALKELMDERFKGTKHFWKAVAEDRPKTAKALKDNIEKYKDEGEFSLEEKIEFGVTLTGMYPMNLILTEKKHKALRSCDVNQISDYDYENPFSWFVIISKQEKVTAKGKKYSILTVTDLTNVQYQIKCWHGTDGLLPHNVYISKLDYEENWGFSTRTENNYRKI